MFVETTLLRLRCLEPVTHAENCKRRDKRKREKEARLQLKELDVWKKCGVDPQKVKKALEKY